MRERRNLFVKYLVLAVIFALAFAVTASADDSAQFVPGTTVNGIGIGGLTVEEAKSRIEGFYDSSYTLTIQKRGNSSETIKGTDIGYRAAAPEGLAALLEKQNAAGRQSGPSVDNSHSMAIQVVYDENALTEKIGGLSCVSGSGIKVTKDASISGYEEGKPFKIIPEVQGNDVDLEKLTTAVREAVSSGKAKIDLAESGCYRTVNITSTDERLAGLLEAMNQIREMKIEYLFGEDSLELTGETVSKWLTPGENGSPVIDREQAAAFIRSLAEQYDTADTVRTFHTASGADIDLKGPYGWRMDQAAELEALLDVIASGQSQSREPVYSLSAASRSGNDWGATYVEVDLTGQHVYLYDNGSLIWDAPCVTGNIAKGHTTPDGIYSLNYKQTDRVLRGAKQADGTYEYESHVNYWMPFNGGIGLHDASWRSKFGGSIYQNGGSHGCVNLPSKQVKSLYDFVYTGIPVICYNTP